MTIIEYRDKSDSIWSVFHFAPGDWAHMKDLADRWGICIREIDSETREVQKEYHPYVPK